MMIKYLFNIIILIALWEPAHTQTKKQFVKAAEEAYNQGNHMGALVYFEEALKRDKNDANIVYKTANSARLYNAYGFAASKYRYLLDTLQSNEYPDAIFHLGEMYHKLGQYDNANKYYKLYLSEYSNSDGNLTTKAKLQLAATNKAQNLINQVDKNVTVIRLGDDINSDDADFAPMLVNNDFYFTSLRFDAKSKNLKYKQIAKTLLQKEGMIPEVVTGSINNRDESVANFAFNQRVNKVYYSICSYIDGWAQQCKLYSSDVDGKGSFSNEQMLPDPINLPNSSNTQPSIGNVNGKELLFFVSDRPDGLGGKDIYSVEVFGNNTFSKPESVKAINTSGDDITPFFHNQSQTLYFSTDGREGFGGFDLFKLTNGSKEVSLLPAPYNTSMNDFYMFLDASGAKGYLTSNRAGSAIQYDSYEACCMDIYGLDIKTDIELDVLTFFEGDKSALNGTKICLIDVDTGKEISCADNPSQLNKQRFLIEPNKNYKIIATKDGYTIASDVFKASPGEKLLSKSLYLDTPDLKLEVFTFDKDSQQALIGTTIQLRNLSDNSVKTITKDNKNSNDFYFTIKPGQEYELIATKDGYTTDIHKFSSKSAIGTIKKEMYLAKPTLQDLLPISLYFDNDYPNPRSRSTQTNSKYVDLALDYINRKPAYITNYANPLSGNEKENAKIEINTFFDADVIEGKDKLIAFMNQLVQRMEKGEKIELEVRGFASPRSYSDYNKILSERRINSIKNELSSFNGGILKKYITNGTLNLKDVSYGDTTAKPNVVSDMKDERNSIYNINAAKERRVEILKINYK
jgi:outer membrane protein OmpA-like peptidoglycan-associated protein